MSVRQQLAIAAAAVSAVTLSASGAVAQSSANSTYTQSANAGSLNCGKVFTESRETVVSGTFKDGRFVITGPVTVTTTGPVTVTTSKESHPECSVGPGSPILDNMSGDYTQSVDEQDLVDNGPVQKGDIYAFSAYQQRLEPARHFVSNDGGKTRIEFTAIFSSLAEVEESRKFLPDLTVINAPDSAKIYIAMKRPGENQTMSTSTGSQVPSP